MKEMDASSVFKPLKMNLLRQSEFLFLDNFFFCGSYVPLSHELGHAY